MNSRVPQGLLLLVVVFGTECAVLAQAPGELYSQTLKVYNRALSIPAEAEGFVAGVSALELSVDSLLREVDASDPWISYRHGSRSQTESAKLRLSSLVGSLLQALENAPRPVDGAGDIEKDSVRALAEAAFLEIAGDQSIYTSFDSFITIFAAQAGSRMAAAGDFMDRSDAWRTGLWRHYAELLSLYRSCTCFSEYAGNGSSIVAGASSENMLEVGVAHSRMIKSKEYALAASVYLDSPSGTLGFGLSVGPVFETVAVIPGVQYLSRGRGQVGFTLRLVPEQSSRFRYAGTFSSIAGAGFQLLLDVD